MNIIIDLNVNGCWSIFDWLMTNPWWTWLRQTSFEHYIKWMDPPCDEELTWSIRWPARHIRRPNNFLCLWNNMQDQHLHNIKILSELIFGNFLKKGTKWILALNVRFLFSNKHIYLSIYIRGSVATVTLLIDNAGQFNIWTLGGSVDATTRQHPAVELAVLYPIWSFFLKLDIKINSIPLSCLSESELAAVFRSMNVLMLCFKLRYKEKNGVQRPNYVFIYFFVSLPY